MKDDETQYIHLPKLERTDTPNPIQGRVKGPDQLYHFIRDVHDATTPKMWGIFLDDDGRSLGNEPLALGLNAEPDQFNVENVFHYYYVFHAKSVALVTNHVNGDPAPTDADRKLIHNIQALNATLPSVSLSDYVIVGDNKYWCMSDHNGTGCHCGQHHYWEG